MLSMCMSSPVTFVVKDCGAFFFFFNFELNCIEFPLYTDKMREKKKKKKHFIFVLIPSHVDVVNV